MRPARRPRYILEIFGGCCCLSGALIQQSLRIAAPIELDHGQWHDVTQPAVQRVILRWLQMGDIWLVFLGTPCTRWSQARGGRAGAGDPAGLACAQFTLRVLRLCEEVKIHFTIENPVSSKLWTWPPLCRQLRRMSTVTVRVDLC